MEEEEEVKEESEPGGELTTVSTTNEVSGDERGRRWMDEGIERSSQWLERGVIR